MNKPKVVIFDIDDTLISFTSFLCTLYYKEKGILISEEDLSWELVYKEGRDSKDKIKYNSDVHTLYKKYERNGLYTSMPALYGSKETLEYLSKLGYKLIILTARPKKFKNETLLYFLNNRLKFDKIIHNHDKASEIKRLSKSYEIICFADDKLSTVRDVASNCKIKHIFLINRPHNRGKKTSKKIKRINNVLECVKWIKHD